MITFRIILLGLITVSSPNTPLLAVKQAGSDVSKIQRMTKWVKSWRLPTKEDVRTILKFLSHEEYVKCLKNRKKCSWKKVAALVALDTVVIAAIIKGKKAFNAAKKRREEEFQEKWKAALPIPQEDIVVPDHIPPKFEEVFKYRKKVQQDFKGYELMATGGFLGSLPWAGVYRGDLEGKSEPWRFGGAYSPPIRRKWKDIIQENKDKRYYEPDESGKNTYFSLIGMAAASHLLDEEKLKEVIDYLIDEVGVVPTEKDRLMVKLFEWEQDELARRKITIFGLPRWEKEKMQERWQKGKKQERLPTEPRIPPEIFPPEIIKEFGRHLTPPPLLPPEEPTGSLGKQEED